MYFESLWKELAALPEVEAAALGGSRSGPEHDERSDYDLYIYCAGVPEEKARHQILEKYCRHIEAGNSFWELEDDCTLKDGVDIDILYRNLDEFSRNISAVVEGHTAYNGYTTCMWHNLLHSRILCDKTGKLARLRSRYSVPYPEELRDSIVQRNLRLLTGNLPSYDAQIKKAAARGDLVSVNHRTAAFLESYFDIIFAWNRLTHPGEKRMVQYAKERAKALPAGFEENLNELFQTLFTDPERAVRTLDRMTAELQKVLKAEK